MFAGSACTLAADPVPADWRGPHADAEQQNLEAVIRDLPIQKSKWAAFANSTLTYVVKQGQDGFFIPDPCEFLPIRIKISHGRLQSANYDSSAGHCHRYQPARRKSPSGDRRYFTPNDLFARIAEAKDQLVCYQPSPLPGCIPTSLYVTYDEKLGLPTKLEDYSDDLSDYYWSLEITEIQLSP